MIRVIAVLALLTAAGLGSLGSGRDAATQEPAWPPPSGLAVATFAGGCFWCMEPPFDALPGVISTTSGYIGGQRANPSYQEVSAGGTGHAEAVQLVYDPARIGYEQLLEVFWRNIDPVAVDHQFCDHGSQYRSAIFVHDADQRRLAEASRDALAVSGRLPGPIATEITDAGPFWIAESYHQDYHLKNPVGYKYYRWGCGRDARLAELWGSSAP
jgi:peptide-methionine (S)-S-oxide reductase